MFVKTLIWTVVNVAFHVGLGVLLAVALNGPIRGKALYRLLLIIPWAVPAYITALTWRGMFDYEYGAVNLICSRHSSPAAGCSTLHLRARQLAGRRRSRVRRPASSPTSGSVFRS